MNNIKQQPFWMVWNPNGCTSTYFRYSKSEAFADAERLANQHPNETFYVLQVVSACCRNSLRHTELSETV